MSKVDLLRSQTQVLETAHEAYPIYIIFQCNNSKASIYLWLYSPCGPWPLFQFLNLYTVGRTPWTVDQPAARPLPTHRKTRTQNKCTQTSMSRVGFEPTVQVFERSNAVHALDRAATVIDSEESSTALIIY
jgi:hypothetical protein